MKLLRKRLSFGAPISSKDPQLEIYELSKGEERAYNVKKFLEDRYAYLISEGILYFAVEDHHVAIIFQCDDADLIKYSWLIKHIKLIAKSVIVKRQTCVY